MAEKQEGYVSKRRDNEAGHIYFYQDIQHCEYLITEHGRKLLKATLVIGDDCVFTESEMRAYEKDLMRALSDPGAFTPRHVEQHPLQHFEETGPQWVSRARAVVRAKHGLSDPA